MQQTHLTISCISHSVSAGALLTEPQPISSAPDCESLERLSLNFSTYKNSEVLHDVVDQSPAEAKQTDPDTSPFIINSFSLAHML